jgi:hypothetical protein
MLAARRRLGNPVFVQPQPFREEKATVHPVARLPATRMNEVPMAGKLDEISRAIGSLETSVRELKRRLDENLKLQARRHADNSAALRELAEKLDQHAAAVAMIRPTVAALELSRSKLATWASIGLTAVVILGWIVEAAVKWTVGAVLAHFQ